MRIELLQALPPRSTHAHLGQHVHLERADLITARARLLQQQRRRAPLSPFGGSTTIVPASDYVSGRWASERDVELRHERRAPSGGPRWRRTRVHQRTPYSRSSTATPASSTRPIPARTRRSAGRNPSTCYRRGLGDQVGSRSGRSPEFLRYATSLSLTASARARSFFRLWFSICRMRSRVTLKVRPTSSSVLGFSPSSP